MSQPAQHHRIDYIEFTTSDVAQSKQFYERAFGWAFQEWGPDYVSFEKSSAGIDGGFRAGDRRHNPSASEPLVVLYSKDLKATEAAIVRAGGEIVVAAFEFPGGKRFHFSDGTGNVLAVWSE
jgi:uncharacterized protein